jgi:hypothetical protein
MFCQSCLIDKKGILQLLGWNAAGWHFIDSYEEN